MAAAVHVLLRDNHGEEMKLFRLLQRAVAENGCDRVQKSTDPGIVVLFFTFFSA